MSDPLLFSGWLFDLATASVWKAIGKKNCSSSLEIKTKLVDHWIEMKAMVKNETFPHQVAYIQWLEETTKKNCDIIIC